MATRMLPPAFIIFAAAVGPQLLAQAPADAQPTDEKRQPALRATGPLRKPGIIARCLRRAGVPVAVWAV